MMQTLIEYLSFTFEIKASGMLKAKTMGVTKEMVQAYKKAEDDILKRMTYISEAILLATPVDPNELHPPRMQPWSPMPCNAITHCLTCRSRGVKIKGKKCFTTTALTSSTVVQCCSGRHNMLTMINALAHMFFLGRMP